MKFVCEKPFYQKHSYIYRANSKQGRILQIHNFLFDHPVIDIDFKIKNFTIVHINE